MLQQDILLSPIEYLYFSGVNKIEILTAKTNGILTAAVSGRIDTFTAPELEKRLNEELEGIKRLVLDLSKTEYLSSAGLRVILGAYKTMEKQDGMLIQSPSPAVMEILVLTGLDNVLISNKCGNNADEHSRKE